MAKNCPELMKDIVTQIRESLKTLQEILTTPRIKPKFIE